MIDFNFKTGPGLLYIRPGPETPDEPLIDSLTRKMTAAFRASEDTGLSFRGFHECRCGVYSSNTDYIVPDGYKVNSLCIHYLAYHRHEVPEADLEAVMGLTSGEAEPTLEEMQPPTRRRVRQGP
jgi:hypothetical protein